MPRKPGAKRNRPSRAKKWVDGRVPFSTYTRKTLETYAIRMRAELDNFKSGEEYVMLREALDEAHAEIQRLEHDLRSAREGGPAE